MPNARHERPLIIKAWWFYAGFSAGLVTSLVFPNIAAGLFAILTGGALMFMLRRGIPFTGFIAYGHHDCDG